METLHEKYGTAYSLYSDLFTHREGLEQEWKDCSELTLPYVFPNKDRHESDRLPTPFNSVGPSAVNALASKLLLALIPPTGNFFRLLPNQQDLEGYEEEALTEIDKQLSILEQDVVELINIQALRVPLFEALKLLIITGNTMLYKVPNGTFKVFNPYQYVVQRDYVGNPITMVIKEKISKTALPREIVEKVCTDEAQQTTESSSRENELDIYTAVCRQDKNTFIVWQEINQIVIESTIKTHKKDKLPYLPLRWAAINNSDYGIGLVQQHIGDLRSLEGLTQLIVEGGGIMAKTVFGLRPASSTQLEDLNNAENGECIMGDLEKDITVLQTQKASDMNIPFQLMQTLENRLSRAFLLFSGQVRDSERTTAAEVRMVASELESTLGGTFSVLSQDLQLPMLTLLLDEINPKVLETTTPSISTGISAISRERDFQNLNVMAQSIAQFGPEVLAQYLKLDGYFTQISTALGIDPDLIVKTTEERKAEQEQQMAQQQAMMQQEASLQQQGGQ